MADPQENLREKRSIGFNPDIDDSRFLLFFSTTLKYCQGISSMSRQGSVSMEEVHLKLVEIEKPENLNFILGQTHFIKSIEDLYETMATSVPNGKYGVAFCEASGACKIRSEGNDEQLKTLAETNAAAIGAGHTFLIFMKDCYPLNVLNAIKNLPEVCTIFCATANPTKVVIAETKLGAETGRGILGVIDGFIPKGLENAGEHAWRKKFLRDIRYKL
jgi:adenosine/AMP kinase